MATQPTSLATATFSTAQLAEAQQALSAIKNGLPRATTAAINKTIAKARTAALRGLTQYLTVRRPVLDKRISIRKATVGRPEATLRVLGREIGLINFKARDTRKPGKRGGQGVVYEIIRGQPVGPGDNDFFIAKSPSGNRHVWERAYGAPRLPISVQYSPSLYSIYTRGPVKGQVETLVQQDLPRQLDSQIDRFLRIRR